jgi:hypothetical protein
VSEVPVSLKSLALLLCSPFPKTLQRVIFPSDSSFKPSVVDSSRRQAFDTI